MTADVGGNTKQTSAHGLQQHHRKAFISRRKHKHNDKYTELGGSAKARAAACRSFEGEWVRLEDKTHWWLGEVRGGVLHSYDNMLNARRVGDFPLDPELWIGDLKKRAPKFFKHLWSVTPRADCSR